MRRLDYAHPETSRGPPRRRRTAAWKKSLAFGLSPLLLIGVVWLISVWRDAVPRLTAWSGACATILLVLVALSVGTVYALVAFAKGEDKWAAALALCLNVLGLGGVIGWLTETRLF